MKKLSRVAITKNCVQIMVILLFVWVFAACSSQSNEYVEPPPPKVTIAQPLQQEVIDYLEFTGTTRAFEEVEIRARVAGFLKSIHFTPGTKVEKGDLLFEIDPSEYQAALNAAEAELNAAKAQHRRADIEFKRAERVFKKGAGAETDVVKWRGERDVALAAIARAESKVEQAKLDLGYTKIDAPIAGRVGRNLVDSGNLVGESEPTLLTQVTRYDPMYAYFNLNERDLLRAMSMYRQRVKDKGLDPDEDPGSEAEIPLLMGLANEEGFPHEGMLDFAESGVDPGTGTLQLRGVFPNPGSSPVLLPGLFARLRMPIDTRADALLVSERAIGADQGGSYLLVVNSENVVEKRPIRMGQLMDGLRVIEEGLNPGERVVVKGIQRARSGAKVDPEKIDMASLTASAINAAAETGQDTEKTTAASSKGDDAQSDKKTEKKE